MRHYAGPHRRLGPTPRAHVRHPKATRTLQPAITICAYEGVTNELPCSLSKISFGAFIAAAARCHIGYGSFPRPPNTMRRIADAPAIKGGAYRCGERWSG